MKSIIISILSFILTFNLIYFILDKLNFSKNKFIRISQILSPLFFILLIYVSYLEVFSTVSSVIDDAYKEINNPNISLDLTAVEIAVKDVANNVTSLGQNVADISNISVNESRDNVLSTIARDHVENSRNRDLSNLILSINIITSSCLILVIMLFNVLLFGLILDENKINLNLSILLGEKLNNNLNILLIKNIRENKKSSLVSIFMIFFVLVIGLSANTYFTTFLLSNLDSFIHGHINK